MPGGHGLIRRMPFQTTDNSRTICFIEDEITRRSALMWLAAMAAPPGLGGLRQTKPVGWAVLGLGSYATNQVMPSFAKARNSKLVALISGHPEKLARYGDQY